MEWTAYVGYEEEGRVDFYGDHHLQSESGVVIVKRQNGERVIVWTGRTKTGRWGAWSPNSTRFVFAGHNEYGAALWGGAVATGELYPLLRGAYGAPQWSQDGIRVFFFKMVVGEDQGEIWVANANVLFDLKTVPWSQ